MKKVLATGAAIMLAGGFAASSVYAADPGVSIKGNARARVIYKAEELVNNFGNGPEDSQLNMDSRVRFDLTGTAAGGAYVKARIRLIEQVFSGAADSSLDNNIYADKAYIGIPFSDTFTLEGGKYRAGYGLGFLYDDIGLAGFRGIYKTDSMMVVPFLEVQKDGQVEGGEDKVQDNDAYRIGGVIQADVAEGWMVGTMLAWDTDDTEEDNEGFFGSIFAKGTMGAIGLEGEFAWMGNDVVQENNDGNSEDDGYGGYLRASFGMDALTIGGDIGFTKDDYAPDEYYGFVMIGGEEPIRGTRIGTYGDWIWIGGWATYQVSEALSLRGNVVYADVDANQVDRDRVADALEISGVLKYTVSKGAVFSWYAGYLAPSLDGAINAEGVNDDGAFGTYAKFDVSF